MLNKQAKNVVNNTTNPTAKQVFKSKSEKSVAKKSPIPNGNINMKPNKNTQLITFKALYLFIIGFTMTKYKEYEHALKNTNKFPNIENINYEIFVSNESIKTIFNEYNEILTNDGYTYHEEYSGEFLYESSKLYYYTFMKGLNGVVIYMTHHNGQTWICYSSGNVLQYQEIFDYMQENDII